jgi:hypothetical protein
VEDSRQAVIFQAFAPALEKCLGPLLIGFEGLAQCMEMLAGVVEVDDLHGVFEAIVDEVPDPFRAVADEDRFAGVGCRGCASTRPPTGRKR